MGGYERREREIGPRMLGLPVLKCGYPWASLASHWGENNIEKIHKNRHSPS